MAPKVTPVRWRHSLAALTFSLSLSFPFPSRKLMAQIRKRLGISAKRGEGRERSRGESRRRPTTFCQSPSARTLLSLSLSR